MGQTSTERLRDYLAQLPPQAQALLMREFERALERGDDVAVAQFVLGELRKVVRGPDDDLKPRVDDPQRLVFAPLTIFLAEGSAPPRPGQIRRSSLDPVWQWLTRDGAPDAARALLAALAKPDASAAAVDAATRGFQTAAADVIAAYTGSGATPDQKRALQRIGPASVIDELAPIGLLLKSREALDALGARMPVQFRSFGDSQVASLSATLGVPALQTPALIPFVLTMVMTRLPASWQIIRLAIKAASSDDEYRVSATPYGVAVTMALHDLSQVAAALRADIKRGQFGRVGDHLKTVHDGVRGLRTELDIRNDSVWGRHLAALRVEISGALQSEIDSVPGRVRRLLRQRPDRDVNANTRLDATEVEETTALIDFVAVCRTYASELAINEVTLRTYSDLQHYVEQATESLVASLRGCDARVRGFRQQQVQAAIAFCSVLFGHDYATLMSRAADNAVTGERKAATG